MRLEIASKREINGLSSHHFASFRQRILKELFRSQIQKLKKRCVVRRPSENARGSASETAQGIERRFRFLKSQGIERRFHFSPTRFSSAKSKDFCAKKENDFRLGRKFARLSILQDTFDKIFFISQGIFMGEDSMEWKGEDEKTSSHFNLMNWTNK